MGRVRTCERTTAICDLVERGVVVSRTGAFEEFLFRYSPAVKVIAFETRSLIHRLIPEAFEIVDVSSKIVAYGYSPKYADLICAIAPYRTYINLIFSRGTELSDPDRLLTGTGKHARHVKIDSPKLVENASLEALIEQALTLVRNEKKGSTLEREK